MIKRDFLAMEEWGQDAVLHLLKLAARIKRGELPGGLEKKVMALMFMDPSLRTRASFETAMFLHGGHAVTLEPGKGSWALETEPGAGWHATGVLQLFVRAKVRAATPTCWACASFPRATTGRRRDRTTSSGTSRSTARSR